MKEVKMKSGLRKLLSVAIIFTWVVSMLSTTVYGFTRIEDDRNNDIVWYNFANNQENNRVTEYPGPTDDKTASLKWAKKYGTGWAASCTPPIIINNKLYVGMAKKVMELDKDTGEILRESDEMVSNVGYAMNPILYADGMLFVQVGNGIIQAIDLQTLKCVWHSEKIGGQTVSNISYNKVNGKGYIYTGTWTGENRDGYFIAVTTDNDEKYKLDEGKGKGGWTKAPAWKFQPSGSSKDKVKDLKYDPDLNATLEQENNVAKRGFYWAGAYTTEKYVAVGTDDGTNEGDYTANGIFYTLNPTTGEIIDKVENIKGDIRSTVVYDNGQLFFCTKGGLVCKVDVDSEGHLSNYTQLQLTDPKNGNKNRMITAAPVIYGNKIYIGASGAGGQFDKDGGHVFAVVDKSNDQLKLLYDIPIAGYPQAATLLSTAYAGEDYDNDGQPDGRVYIYFTYNAPPGGIYYIYDTPEAKEPITKGKELFIPEKNMQQYCISTIIADLQGNLYYKNDSCYLMSIETNAAFITNAEVKTDKGTDAVWDKSFAQNSTEYNLKVGEDVSYVTLKLQKPDPTGIKVNDKPYEENMKVQLNETGETEIRLEAKAGEQTKTYTLKVKKIGADASLASLQASTSNREGADILSMEPEFSAEKLKYKVDITDVDIDEVGIIRVWPKPSAENSSVKVEGTDNVESVVDLFKRKGYFGVYFDDPNKPASINVTVTSENGAKTQTYKLTFAKKVKVNSVSIENKQAALDMADSPLKLKANINPDNATDKTGTWYIMDTEKHDNEDDLPATITQDGVVTPAKKGNVRITFITNDGSKTDQFDMNITDLGLDVADEAKKLNVSTLKDKANIDAVKGKYEKLTKKQKERADKLGYSTAISKAEAEYNKLAEAAAQEERDKAAAKAVENKIDAIGALEDIALDKMNEVAEARTAYDALTETQKSYVPAEKLDKLVKAENKIKELKLDKAKKDAKEAVNSYKDLNNYRPDEQRVIKGIIANTLKLIDVAKDEDEILDRVKKAKAAMDQVKTDAELTLEEKAKERAAQVDAVIQDIGEVTFSVDSRDKILKARDAYNNLDDSSKKKVKKLAELEAAEKKYAELVKNAELKTLSDEATKLEVVGKFMDSAKLVANELSADDANKLKDAFKLENLDIEKYFSVDARIEGGYEEALKVVFNVGDEYEGKKVIVKAILTDGSIGTYTAYVNEGKASIYVDSLAKYMIGIEKEKINQPGGSDSSSVSGGHNKTTRAAKTGDASDPELWIITSLLSLGLSIILLRKRNNQ